MIKITLIGSNEAVQKTLTDYFARRKIIIEYNKNNP